MGKNVVIAQSGGPSPVINNSLRGVIDTCLRFPETFGRIYGGWHGIEGVLKEELLDINAQPAEEIQLLRTTPAAGAIGTCRYKLKKNQQEDFNRIIDVFRAHDIGFLFYIGSNDSMDLANKIALAAREKGLDVVCTGVAKTIDNDVGDTEFKLIDHTPGYGSVARYWGHTVQNANEENRGSSPADPVLVLQAMGRRIGYIPAAARLADPGREMPLLILLAEARIGMEEVCDRVSDSIRAQGRCLVVVSEGFPVGELGETRDSFGHIQFGASKMTVQQKLVNCLNEKGLSCKGSARGQVMGTDQRDTMIYASTVDLDEAYKIGQNAALVARNDGNGWMSTILRKPGPIYQVYYDKVSLADVAKSERAFPKRWIARDKVDVTDEFLEYVRPLVGEDWVSVPMVNGRQRFAQFKSIFVAKKLAAYVPQADRK